MTTVRILSLIVGVVLLVVAIIAIICFPSADKGDFIRMAKMLPEDIGTFSFVDVAMLRADNDLNSMWTLVKDNYLGQGVYGENVSKITGFGMAGSDNSLMLYKGDFDFNQITSAIEQNSVESYDYKGVKIWTDRNALSTAVIDDVVFIGKSEDVKLCIDLHKGEGSSLYDSKDAKDIIGRLPGGYVLGVMVNESFSARSYGIMAAGMAVSKQNGNISDTSLFKFNGSAAAQKYMTAVKSQMPSGYDVTQDGQYLTVSSTSAILSPNEEAYNLAYNDLQNAVTAYAANNSYVFPTINGTVNISGYDLHIVDICPLLNYSEGGMLTAVPGGVASINGSDNDNCDAGCDGCLDTNHYIWAIDEYGYLYSTCVGANCSAQNTDGYQGVWP